MAPLAEVVAAGRVGLPGASHLALEELDATSAAGASHLVHFAGGEEGPEAALQAAEEAGVRRLVWVGDARLRALSLDPEHRSPGGRPIPELLQGAPRTAARARALERALSWTGRLEVVALLHGWLLDPQDRAGDLARLRGALQGERPVDSGGTALCDARDLLGAVEGALHRGARGRAWVLASRNIRWPELWGWLRRAGGPTRPLEAGELPIGRYGELVDDAAAREELGWWTRRPDRSLAEAMGGARLSVRREEGEPPQGASRSSPKKMP